MANGKSGTERNFSTDGLMKKSCKHTSKKRVPYLQFQNGYHTNISPPKTKKWKYKREDRQRDLEKEGEKERERTMEAEADINAHTVIRVHRNLSFNF